MSLILQSAAIPYRLCEEGIEIVLVTNSKRSHWIYPKGMVEPDMTPAQSAANEAFEEAGVTGTVSDHLLDSYWYEKWDSDCRVFVFPLEVDEVMEHWDEKGMRERKIVSLAEALEIIKDEQRAGLEQLALYLENSGN